MRMAPALALALGVCTLAACDATPSPVAPPDTETAAARPAGVGTCKPKSLDASQKGHINPGSCLYAEAIGRRSQYYDTSIPDGEMLTLEVNADFAGVFGVMEAKQDPTQGFVRGSLGFAADTPRRMMFIGHSPQRVFVSNQDETQRGKFQLDATMEPVAYRCGIVTVLEAVVHFDDAIDADRSCHWNIEVSPYPEAIGEALLGHYYNTKMIGGLTYEIRLEGVSDAFGAGLVFYGFPEPILAVGPVPADGVRTLTVTPDETGYWGIEVSSGQPDGMGGWITPEGPFRLTVTEVH